MEESVLLETTIQLFRIAHGPQVRRTIEDMLSGKEVLTTGFVFREFLRSIVQDVRYVHDQASELPEPVDGIVALCALDRKLALNRGNYSARSVKRQRLVTAIILQDFSATQVPLRRLLVRLQRLGEQWVYDFFHAYDGAADPPRDIICINEIDGGNAEIERLSRCNPFPEMPSFPGGAAAFLHKHRDLVLRAEDGMQSPPPDSKPDPALLEILSRLKSDNGEYDFLNRLSPRTRGNWHLGDLLISLETPERACIFTTDRHYEILTKALSKRLCVPPSESFRTVTSVSTETNTSS